MAIGHDLILAAHKEAENYLGETILLNKYRITALVSEIRGGTELEVGGSIVTADGTVSVRKTLLSSVPTMGTVVTARSKACRVVSVETDTDTYRLLIAGLHDRR
jgi:hypothetical protein